MTAVYTFRMIFRAFLGDPVPEARELEETGHLHHADVPRNPMTGEEEDTDVGFPGPEHHIAEQAFPMKLAMGVLALLAVDRRAACRSRRSPRSSTTSSSRRSPSRDTSRSCSRRTR